MSEIGNKVKEIRNKFNLSQERFGKKIGVSGKTVSAYETGRAVPPERIINAISQIFCYPIVYMDKSERTKLRDQLSSMRSFLESFEKVISEY